MISQKMFLIGRWLAPTNVDVSCMATLYPRPKDRHPTDLRGRQEQLCVRATFTLSTDSHWRTRTTVTSGVTLVVQADTTSVKANVVLVFVAFVLCYTKQHSILHLQPELAVFVSNYTFVLFLENIKDPQFNTWLRTNIRI